MTKNLLSLSAVAVLALTLSAGMAMAADPCKDGTAPDGWKRAGGYCEVSASNHLGGDGNFAGSGTTSTDGHNWTVYDKNGAVVSTYTTP